MLLMNDEYSSSDVSKNNDETERLIDSFIEVELADDDAFLKIKETLTRIGIANFNKNRLTQTCHILQKRGRYYIVHFFQLFQLDGKHADFTKEDAERVSAIACLLEEWRLCTIVDKTKLTESGEKPNKSLTIIDFKSKDKWTLQPKYTFGKNGKHHATHSDM